MSLVFETLTLHLPHKRKATPSGWTSFNAPCCIHNGTGADTRQRGGIKAGDGGGVSYHCFNCGFTASWMPGRRITYKMKRLMQWLNVPDDTITKISLQVLETELSSLKAKLFAQQGTIVVPGTVLKPAARSGSIPPR